jgi:hypothetical protein
MRRFIEGAAVCCQRKGLRRQGRRDIGGICLYKQAIQWNGGQGGSSTEIADVCDGSGE